MEIKTISAANNDSKNFACLTWVGMIFVAFWAPLSVYLFKTDDDFVREHAIMSLNWSLTLLALILIGAALSVIMVGVYIIAAAWICNVIFGIMGAIAARKGEYYNCPMTIKLLK